ncbi:hypothetical protein FHS31_002700 [Sphingomonas vulcanisoli]|uniref:Ice-binding protein C-terminal domain-containing protein n=1 Tax=Sphingomonas vulcanisoli TaxID=1658060 RepID=A0ABX0TU67_9SPHN|nr:PEPxxWA-CTERM sorting domain-containing protein [Sphingomonas vulcanisoli]NIJ09068.1 hypothetical protein [Sphingomonas vulcanisoli]
MRKLLSAGVCLLSAVIGGSAAQASLVPTLVNSPVAVSGGYLYTYNIKLTGDQGLSAAAVDPQSGRMFDSQLTIFDFAGYVAGSANVNFNTALDPGGNFIVTTPNTTDTTFLATVPGERDSADVPNLVLNYTGPDYRTTGGGDGATNNFQDVFIATVSAISVYNDTDYTSFSGIGVKNTGTTTANTAAFNAGSTLAPVAQVPEAATWAMMVIGFGVVGASLRSRRAVHAIANLG